MENNKKKNEKKKRKLRTLILLLFLTIIMFGTSTYAWFTANQTVTIQSINVHVETSDGIQISTNGSTWKSIITTADIIGKDANDNPNYYAAADNFIPNTLDAVSTDGTLLYDSSAGTKKMDFYSSVIGTDTTSGNYTIKTNQINEATDKTKFVAFDIFLKVSSAKDVYLNSKSTFSNVVPMAGSAGGDKGLKNAARVAFVPIGEALATDPVTTITGAYDEDNNLTAKLKIWEPNSDFHSEAVKNSVAPSYHVTLTETSSGSGLYNAVPYRGVTDVIGTPQDLINTVNSTVTTGTEPVSAGTVSTTNNVYSSTGLLLPTPITLDYVNTDYKVFSLPAGITKMRIYMWIEGQDIDCENNASGTDITFNLEFTIPQATPASSNP